MTFFRDISFHHDKKREGGRTMKKRSSKEIAQWLILIAVGLVILEFFVFNPGLIFSLFVAIGMIYVSKQSMKGMIGKIFFWTGIFIVVVSIFSMFTFKLLLFSIVIYYVIQYVQKKEKVTVINPIIKEKQVPSEKETMVKKKPMFSNTLFNRNVTPDHVYEWEDVNIQCGVTDTIIDLSYTVLPEGETVILIRNIIGNVEIQIPYDMEVNINHSSLFGSYTIFEEREENVLNRNVLIQTAQFNHANTRVKLITSFIVGNLEVKRI